MPNGEQVKNGKAFEYAIAKEYKEYLEEKGIPARFEEDAAFKTARSFFKEFDERQQYKYALSARATIKTLIKLEPGLNSPKNDNDILSIKIAADGRGEEGDVRDVLFSRSTSHWEVGFSAKNNNDAVKHSRLSHILDFGQEWLGYPVSDAYWDGIRPVFDKLKDYKREKKKWCEIENVHEEIYLPILNCFRDELMRIYSAHEDVPEKLISYLLGREPFYKIIKDDNSSTVIVKAINIGSGLNKTVNGTKPQYRTAKLNYPTRIIEFTMKINRDKTISKTTLNMILDEGWEISFRLHSAETYVIPSLKFDVQLLGNPPVLFTQYIFQDK